MYGRRITGNGKLRQEKIIYGKGKGKDYSDVSREVEQTFNAWIDHAGLDTEELERRLKAEPHKVIENINSDGNIEINIYSGGEVVIEPLVFVVGGGVELDDFIVNALLLFSYIAAKYSNKSFEKSVIAFADKMIAEKKISLNNS